MAAPENSAPCNASETAAAALSTTGAKAQQAAKQWLADHQATLPTDIAAALASAIELASQIRALEPKRRALLRQLRRALGIVPSTERHTGSANQPKSPDEPQTSKKKPMDPLERLRAIADRAKRLARWHRRCLRQQVKRKIRAEKKLMELEDVELSPEEEAELAREDAESEARMTLGDGADPRFVPHAETLMHGTSSSVRNTSELCEVDPLDIPKGAVIKQRFHESRERIDFSFSLTVMDISVEKLAIKTRGGETTLITGDMETFGPAKSRVTWNFLANMAILVSQYVMPFNRFGRLVSSPHKQFTAAEISRYYRFVADHFVPIYIHLGRSLAQAPVLAGDDTPSLVLDVSRALSGAESAPLPWASFETPAAAQAHRRSGGAPTTAHQLAEAFGFASLRKDGTGSKVGFNTTTLSGRTHPDDPKSTIVFYRSHLGGLGNLLDAILPHRLPQHRDLVVQSDLSTVNLISDASVLARLNLTLAGCFSHARRPFSIHRDDDPDLCDPILHCFKAIPIYEGAIDAHGRNEVNTLAVRDVDPRLNWEMIRDLCSELTSRWSRQTPLGEGARYVLRHYDRLTYYLGDARISSSNNFSERMLRLEKLIGRNSLFRQTLSGRFSLDIMRTVLQTCIAAGADLTAYLMWVMRMPKEAVDADPGSFTPQAFAQWWARESAAADLEDPLATPVS